MNTYNQQIHNFKILQRSQNLSSNKVKKTSFSWLVNTLKDVDGFQAKKLEMLTQSSQKL
jgi:hypothetical protein